MLIGNFSPIGSKLGTVIDLAILNNVLMGLNSVEQLLALVMVTNWYYMYGLGLRVYI